MKLSDYRNKVLEEYPDAFMDNDKAGFPSLYMIYGNSSRSVILGKGIGTRAAWQAAYFEHIHIPLSELYFDDGQ